MSQQQEQQQLLNRRLITLNVNAVQHIQIKRPAYGVVGASATQQPESPLSNTNAVNNATSGSLSPLIQYDLNDFKDLIAKCKSSSSHVNDCESKNNLINQLSFNNRQYFKIGNYLLFETQSLDLYNTAYNLSNDTYYYWKKFTASNYMKKLEAYFLMEGNTQTYKFSEIVKNGGEDVYVFFEQHHGDLHSYMKEKKRLKESEAKRIFYQIVQVVQACHENGVIVRDIKLKKFVFANEEKTQILLANLEDCLVLESTQNDLIKSQQGCPAYVSPEVLNQSLKSYSGKLSDSWSLGIVLYTLLFGRYPFHHNQIAAMFAKITKGKFQIPTNGISLNAKTLIRALIRLQPHERLYPNDILSHRWFDDAQLVDFFHVNISNKPSSTPSFNQEQFNFFANEFASSSSSSSLVHSKPNNSNPLLLNSYVDEQLVPTFDESSN